MANWDNIGSEGNVEDRRGVGGGTMFAGVGGVLAILLTLGLNYFAGIQVSPQTVEQILSQVQSFQSTQADQSSQPVEFQGDDSYEVFTKKVSLDQDRNNELTGMSVGLLANRT